MVIESKDTSGTTPVTAGRTPRAKSNSVKAFITHADARVDEAIHFDDFEASDQDSEEDVHADDNDDVKFSHEAGERSLHVVHVSTLAELKTSSRRARRRRRCWSRCDPW